MLKTCLEFFNSAFSLLFIVVATHCMLHDLLCSTAHTGFVTVTLGIFCKVCVTLGNMLWYSYLKVRSD